MQHAISGRLAQARLADLRQDAQRGTIARAARRARPRRPGRAGPVGPTLDRQVRRKPSPRTVLAIASLSGAIAFIDATIVNIAFPDIAHSFPGTPISALSWVLNAYNIVFAAFLMAAAGLADVLGRRRVFIFGLALFTAGSLLCAVAPSATALIAFRVIQALGAAFLVPSALALVLNAFPPARRSHAVALLSAVSAAAAGLGPSLGGLLVAAANWRLVFLVNVPIGVAAILLARRQLAESRAPGRRRVPDLPGTLLFAAAIGTLVLGVVKGQDWGWGSPRILGCLTAALGLGAAVIWRCRRHRWPILDLSLLKIRTFSVANAMTVIGAAGFFGYTLANVLFLTSVWRYSVLQAGLALTIGPAVAVAMAGPTSRLAQRLGPRPVLVVGGLVWGGAVLWFVERVGVTPDFVGQWLPGMILLGIGAGTLFPNLSGTAVASAPGGSFATATGMNSVARQIGAALGVAVVVAIIGTPTPATADAVFHDAWTFGAICLFVAGLGCLLVGHVKVSEVPAPGEDARGDAAGRDAARAVLENRRELTMASTVTAAERTEDKAPLAHRAGKREAALMSGNDVTATRVVAVLLADGWHRVVPGSFRVGPLSFGAEAGPGTPGFHFEEADAGRPYQPTVLAGPLGSIIAVRQVTPAALRVGDLDRARAAHDAQRADQGTRLRIRAGRQ